MTSPVAGLPQRRRQFLGGIKGSSPKTRVASEPRNRRLKYETLSLMSSKNRKSLEPSLK